MRTQESTDQMDKPPQIKVKGRFVFLTGQPCDGPRNPLDAGYQGASLAAWQLLAANNRVVGRSAQLYPTLEECHRAALRLHERAATAVYSVASLSKMLRWTWVVRVEDEVVARAAHNYQRRIECVRSARQFLDVAQETLPRIEDVRHLGANSFFGGAGLA